MRFIFRISTAFAYPLLFPVFSHSFAASLQTFSEAYEKDKRRGMEAGALAYLARPFDFDVLEKELARLIGEAAGSSVEAIGNDSNAYPLRGELGQYHLGRVPEMMMATTDVRESRLASVLAKAQIGPSSFLKHGTGSVAFPK